MSLPVGETEIPVFISATDLRASLGTDSENPRVAECAISANSQITLAIKPYAETTPIRVGTPTYMEVQRVALLYAQYMWYLRMFQRDTAESFRKQYDGALKDLKTALTVQPTPRQEPFLMSVSDFEGERRVPYSQIGFAGDTENLY